MNEPVCQPCDERGVITLAAEERGGEPYCGNCATSRDERDYEASLSNFYGGSGPQTVGEFCARALADKQGAR